MRYTFLILVLISHSCESQNTVSDIVLVNVGPANRKDLAELIDKVNQLEPSVVAIDLQFSSDQGSEIDNMLIAALEKSSNLVMVSVIEDYSPDKLFHKRLVPGCLPKFTRNAKTGFVNLNLEEDKLIKFSQLEYVDGKSELSFALRTAFQHDSVKTRRFMKTHSNFTKVNFDKGLKQFRRFSIAEFLGNKVNKEHIKGKIVMIGFLGPGTMDKYYSPTAGDGDPNIYGLEFHSQVVSQILEYHP